MDSLSTEDSKFTHHSAPAGYWGWEPAGKSISIQISFEVVDRMLSSIIDGFGSIPKRGAEVGGLLIGTRTAGSPVVYRIEEYVDVPCQHKFGPSYVYGPEDHEAMQEALAKAGSRVIGFYRSHTRDGLFLAPEDLELTRRYFGDEEQIVLLVRPSAMGVSHAGFFYRENGTFQQNTDLEFPFRRSELETGAAPVRRPLGERIRGEQGRRGPMPPPGQTPTPSHPPREPLSMPSPPSFRREEYSPMPQPPPEAGLRLPYDYRGGGSPAEVGGTDDDIPMPSQVYAVTTPSQSRFRKGWYWLPLSFIFLLLGVLLGFQAAMTIYPSSRSGSGADAYGLMLNISRSGNDVTVRWDRQNGAVRASRRGALEIVDGKYTKHVDLDSQQLQSGSVIYRFSSNQLKFKLEVFPQEKVSVSETAEWSGDR